jgi:SAM-dependent methyltransferase
MTDARSYWERRYSTGTGFPQTSQLGFGKSFNRWTYRRRFRALDGALHALGISLKGMSVCDVGIGGGMWVEYWASRGATAAGMDLAANAVDAMRSQYPDLRVVQWDMTDPNGPPFPEGSFDVVAAFDNLFLVGDDEEVKQALTNLSRLLKPNGVVLISGYFGTVPMASFDTAAAPASGPSIGPPTGPPISHRTIAEYQEAFSLASLSVLAEFPFVGTLGSQLDRHARRSGPAFLIASGVLPLVRRASQGQGTDWMNNVPGALLYGVDQVLFPPGHFCHGPSLNGLVLRKDA